MGGQRGVHHETGYVQERDVVVAGGHSILPLGHQSFISDQLLEVDERLRLAFGQMPQMARWVAVLALLQVAAGLRTLLRADARSLRHIP